MIEIISIIFAFIYGFICLLGVFVIFSIIFIVLLDAEDEFMDFMDKYFKPIAIKYWNWKNNKRNKVKND